MNFSDRCDTVHVFHSHQNGRTVRSDQVPLTRDIFDSFSAFPFKFSFFSLRGWFQRFLDDLTMLYGRLSFSGIV